MSDDSSSTPQQANLEIDLALSFQPAWVKEAGNQEKLARMADRFEEGGDRPRGRKDDRRGGGRRDDRRPSRDSDRPPRRDGGGRDQQRRGKREDFRGGPRREEPKPEPVLSGWELSIITDARGNDGLARQIKSTAVAYPLFDLAQLVLEKSERYKVLLKQKDGPALFQFTTDGSVWLSEREALAHALARHLETFYRRERETVEPPKGSYSCVAVCGLSDTLLGPPNYHDYQDRLRKLHAERFAHMSFEAYKGRVKMVRDEEMIQKWKDERSSKDVFYPVTAENPVTTQDSVPTENSVPAENPATPENSVAGEEAAPIEEAAAAEGSIAAEDSSATENPATPEKGSDSQKLESLAAVERHFREHHAASVIVSVSGKAEIPGPAILHSSTPTAKALARRTVDELRRFPLPLAHTLGQALVGRGLHIFKAHENITYVSIARPRYLDRATTPISEALSGILTFLEEHPETPRDERRKALAALRPVAEGSETERDAALARDLSWLLHEGYVVDYARKGLEAVRRPKSRQEQPQ